MTAKRTRDETNSNGSMTERDVQWTVQHLCISILAGPDSVLCKPCAWGRTTSRSITEELPGAEQSECALSAHPAPLPCSACSILLLNS